MVDMKEILRIVLELSQQGKLDWKTTSSETIFLAPGGKQSLVVGIVSTERYFLKVLGDSGTDIGTITEFSSNIQGKQIKAIYELASRKALRVDEQLEELLAQLRNKAGV